MGEKLIVKTISKKLIHEIQSDGVKIYYSKWVQGVCNYYEYKILFEDIGQNLTYKRGKKFAVYIFLIFLFLSIIGLIINILELDGMQKSFGIVVYVPSIILCSICAYLSYRDENLRMTYLNTRRDALFFIETEKSKDEVKKFIESISVKVKEYLKQKYGTFDEDLPLYFQLNNIELLKANETITEEEYAQMIAQIEGKEKIGFQISTNQNK